MLQLVLKRVLVEPDAGSCGWPAMLPALGSSRSTALGRIEQQFAVSCTFTLQGHSGGENALQQTASMQGRSPESRLLRAMSGESHPDAEDLAATESSFCCICSTCIACSQAEEARCAEVSASQPELRNAEVRKSSLACSEVVSDRDEPWLKSFEAARLTSLASDLRSGWWSLNIITAAWWQLLAASGRGNESSKGDAAGA